MCILISRIEGSTQAEGFLENNVEKKFWPKRTEGQEFSEKRIIKDIVIGARQ
jgi:hypothetical protein